MWSYGFHHVALQVDGVEKVAAFYVDTFGLKELARHFRDDGTLRSIWLAASSGAEPQGGFIAVELAPHGSSRGEKGPSLLALRIDTSARERVRQELVAKGITIEKETRWTLYVRDPEGNWVGLSHHPYDVPVSSERESGRSSIPA
ncbi:MAG: VOC family protein [Myxococcaceae bacterium]|nr:VOC family protein [Myxococcaceae bacterium]